MCNETELPLKSPALGTLVLVVLMLCAGGLVVSGCKSAEKQPVPGFAAVELTGNTPGQISEMAQEVFAEQGYQVARSGVTSLVFEKKGTGMNNAAYGNWLGDAPVWVRVKAQIGSVAGRTFRLECQAYMVRDRGAATEEEIKLGSMRRKPYQKLLDEVAARLKRIP